MSSKTLYLIFYGRFPCEKAASLWAAKSCEAFGNTGIRVVLIVPKTKTKNVLDPYKYYNIKNNFSIISLSAINAFSFNINSFIFSLVSTVYLLHNVKKGDFIYSNESLSLFFLSFFFPNTFFEMHVLSKKKFFYKLLFKKVKGIISINQWKIDESVRTLNIPKEKFICEPSAVDIKQFDINISKESARKELNLPVDKKIILYTGHLYGWKGVDTLSEAGQYLPSDVLIVFVGGTEIDIKKFKIQNSKFKNILILGYRPHAEIPLWQKASDVLVLPNSAKKDISKFYTSPMKLFEYMVSKRPIVASKIPSIIEILNCNNSILVTPDDPKALATGIQEALNNSKLSKGLSGQAYQDVQKYSIDKRAKRALDFMKSLL
ncbi:MAG: glycosyltransferase [bacterium]